ncbi:P63C domain-containing protein [Flaviflexus salsibiostraticola]|uniref:P63C domain-containing protein n=1 Tax=Flaviflexus salsibiostraticola TaxID=1282737 RepID=UPI001B871991
MASELQPWVKTFDVSFYKQLFRLRGLPFDPASMKKPRYFGKLTNNIVYERLAVLTSTVVDSVDWWDSGDAEVGSV